MKKSDSILHFYEAEVLVLGRAIQDVEHRKICSNSLHETDFSTDEHRIIFQALLDLEKNRAPADVSLLAELLKKKNVLKKAGGVAHLVDLVQKATFSVHVPDYIHELKERKARRSTLEILRTQSFEVASGQGDIHEIVERLSSKLKLISQEASKLEALSLYSVSQGSSNKKPFLSSLEERINYFKTFKKPYVEGVSTGFLDLDQILGGFCNSNLVILAARPGMGKTALALNFLINVANQNKAVGMLSLEMTGQQLYERLISKSSSITSDKIREGNLTDIQKHSIEKADEHLKNLPVFFLEGECQIGSLMNKIRRLKEEQGIAFFIIDYLQLIQAKAENRLLEISLITRALKNLSLEINIPILCLSQLSRKVEDRADKKPQLSDLRESGSIEQDADSVLFLMCPDYYDPYNKPGQAELFVSKNRHGQTGKITLQYAKDLSQFNNLILYEDQNGF